MVSGQKLNSWFLKFQHIVFYLFTVAFLTLSLFLSLELIAYYTLKLVAQGPPDTLRNQRNMSAYSYYPWRDEFFEEIEKRLAVAVSSKPYSPYSLWKEHPYRSRTFNIDEDGYRNTINGSLDANHAYHVWIFGGSTTFCEQVPDSDTLPSLVSLELNKRFPSRRFLVKNYGVNGFVSDQEVVLLTQLLSEGRKPDFVIFYDGINETHTKVVAGAQHTFYHRFEAVLDREFAAKEFLLSAVSKLSLAQLLGFTPNIEYIRDKGILKERAETMLERYKRNVSFVSDALSQAFGFRALFLWQPSIFATKKSLSEEERAILSSQREEVRLAFEVVDALANSELFRSGKVHDFRDAFDDLKHSIFIDAYHVTTIGNNAVSQKIAQLISSYLKTSDSQSVLHASD